MPRSRHAAPTDMNRIPGEPVTRLRAWHIVIPFRQLLDTPIQIIDLDPEFVER